MLFVFGPQWEPSIPAFQILSLSVGLQIVMSSSGSFFQSSNDTRGLFICGIFTAFVTCTGFLICILFFRTLEAFAYSMLISYILSFIQCYWQLYHYQFHRSILHLYSQLISPLFITLFIGGLLYIISFYSINWNILISLCIKSFLTLLLWGSYIQWRKEYDIINKVKKCFRKR